MPSFSRFDSSAANNVMNLMVAFAPEYPPPIDLRRQPRTVVIRPTVHPVRVSLRPCIFPSAEILNAAMTLRMVVVSCSCTRPDTDRRYEYLGCLQPRYRVTYSDPRDPENSPPARNPSRLGVCTPRPSAAAFGIQKV